MHHFISHAYYIRNIIYYNVIFVKVLHDGTSKWRIHSEVHLFEEFFSCIFLISSFIKLFPLLFFSCNNFHFASLQKHTYIFIYINIYICQICFVGDRKCQTFWPIFRSKYKYDVFFRNKYAFIH